MRSYWCFLSYRHADNKEAGQQWASWLHQAIETYEVPEDLVGTTNGRGDEIPERIFPVFRDEEELPADADLAAPIGRALDQSKTLVVLCSPRAVESKYVAEEILIYKQQGKSDRIMAALLDGEPNASRDPSKDAEECFPKPLLHPIGEDGQLLEDEWAEPIAADFRLRDGSEGWTSPAAYREALVNEGKLSRSERDHVVAEYGKQLELAKLKVIAGILGVPLGTLTKRDKAYQLEKEQRRARVFRAVAGVMGVLAVAAVVAGVFALLQKNEAEAQRTQAELAAEEARIARDDAEGLVYFLTKELGQDFRDYLPLRLQEQINEEVEVYFKRRQEAGELEPSEESWGFLFQLANLQWAAGEIPASKKSFLESVEVADRMGELGTDPTEQWRGLAGKSLGWMSEMIRGAAGEVDEAEALVIRSMEHYEVLLGREPDNRDWKEGVAVSKTRYASVFLIREEFETAEKMYREAEVMRRELVELEPRNGLRVQRYGVALNRLGELNMTLEKYDEAYKEFSNCNDYAERLLELEPGNLRYRREYAVGQSTLGNVEIKRGNMDEARTHFMEAEGIMRGLILLDEKRRSWGADLVTILSGEIEFLKSKESWEEALRVSKESMELQSDLAEATGRMEVMYGFALMQRSHSELWDEMPDGREEELGWLRKSEETFVAIAKAFPENVYVQYHAGVGANWLASVLAEQDSGDAEALKCLDRAKEVWTGLLDDEKVGEWCKDALEGQKELYEKARTRQVEKPVEELPEAGTEGA